MEPAAGGSILHVADVVPDGTACVPRRLTVMFVLGPMVGTRIG